jgi:signal transduction histidine kinase
MSAETIPARTTGRGNSLLSVPRQWLEPRSTDRDEAFRERSLRVAIGLVILIGLLSFALTIFVFPNEWAVISYPTLHIVVLIGFLTAAWEVMHQRIDTSATLVVLTSLVAAFGFILVIGRQAPYAELINGIPIFMFVILLSALVMQRRYIVPISGLAVLLYAVAMLSTSDALSLLPAFEISPAIITAIILFPTEGVVLNRLRVEFDARLNAMRESIALAEQAKQQAEVARQQAEVERKRAEESDKAKSQFLANMSHELRTPLNAIIGYDEAMLGGLAGDFSPQQTKLLGHIQFNSRRLLGLINDILDLSKIESGSLQVFLAPMSPQKVVRESVESLRSLADQKNIYLNVNFADTVPEIVLGDASKMQQILINLLSNAIKFTEAGGVTVDVTSADQLNWQLKVADTGIGMPPGASDTIFEPFHQLDSTDKRKYKGTGLGLSITKRLVERLGGRIDVETELGVGSTFIVRLPRTHIPGETVEVERAQAAELKHE